MYETYPKKTVGAQVGKKTGWGDGHGVSYPGKGLPTTMDSTGKSHITQHGGTGSPCACDYPKKSTNRFPGLDGLPS